MSKIEELACDFKHLVGAHSRCFCIIFGHFGVCLFPENEQNCKMPLSFSDKKKQI